VRLAEYPCSIWIVNVLNHLNFSPTSISNVITARIVGWANRVGGGGGYVVPALRAGIFIWLVCDWWIFFSLWIASSYGRMITSLGAEGRTNFTLCAELASRVAGTLRVARSIFLFQ
jgi:hypothetical protein